MKFHPWPGTLTVLVAALGLFGTACHAGTGKPALRHDVFARPALEGASAPAQAGAETTPKWHPVLRAIVQAGPRSMVIVDRAVVEVGGKIDGYRLVKVDSNKAVFSRRTKRVVLTLGRERDDAP